VSAADGAGRDLEYAARFTGLSKFTLRAYLRRGLIAHYRIGRRIVLKDSDLEAFMRRHRVEAREAAGR
jgi:excisionase family DNA binding protein